MPSTISLKQASTIAEIRSRRIAGDKIEQCLRRLGDLRRSAVEPLDKRIFPGYYAPVLIVENGRRVIKPMRYQCRLAGKPAFYDVKFPGTYNARVDNLEGYWKPLFGRTHGLVVVEAFYENVARHRMEGRELREGEADQNVVLEFEPQPPVPMLAACLWSRWTAPGQPELLSFAAITDEPPPAIAAAGHDRCIVPIKQGHMDAWLNPDPRDFGKLYEILRGPIASGVRVPAGRLRRRTGLHSGRISRRRLDPGGANSAKAASRYAACFCLEIGTWGSGKGCFDRLAVVGFASTVGADLK